jgi:hypothetical protein
VENEDLGNKLDKISDMFNEAMEELKTEQEAYWNSLSKDDQLKAFCAVVRRIHKGDIEDKGSYRYVLYQVFDFGPESYAQAQMAGYLTLHNCIFDSEHELDTLKAFAAKVGVENPEEAVYDFYRGRI